MVEAGCAVSGIVETTVRVVLLRGGPDDGLRVTLPRRGVKVCIEGDWYYKTNKHKDGTTQFTHESIWGRA